MCLLCCEDRDGAGIGAFSLCISLCFLKVRMILEEELCFLYESKADANMIILFFLCFLCFVFVFSKRSCVFRWR